LSCSVQADIKKSRTFGGLEKKLALGTFPEISLSAARQKRAEAKGQVAQGVDTPALHPFSLAFSLAGLAAAGLRAVPLFFVITGIGTVQATAMTTSFLSQ